MDEADRQTLEACIAWAAQQGYVYAERAAAALERQTGREMYSDQPYYNSFAWRDLADR